MANKQTKSSTFKEILVAKIDDYIDEVLQRMIQKKGRSIVKPSGR